MADSDGATCICQPILDDLFKQLIPCPLFFAHLIDDPSDIAEEVSRIAANDELWARHLVKTCMADVMKRTSTREDIFRADLPATRCIKTVLIPSFSAVANDLLRTRMPKFSGSADVERQVSKLFDLLATARWPSIVSVCAEAIVQAAEGKFAGSGNTALVGIFWLRILCPLILQRAAKLPSKSPKQPKPSRLLEIVKLLQARANCFGSTEAAGSNEDPIRAKIRAALSQLLVKSSVQSFRTPPDIASTQKLGQWIAGHSVVIGRSLKSQGSGVSGVFGFWLTFLSNLRDLASRTVHAEEHQAAIEFAQRQTLSSSPNSASSSSSASPSSSSSSSSSSSYSSNPISPRGGVMSDPEDGPFYRGFSESRSFPLLPINDDDPVRLRKKESRGSRLRVPTLMLKRRFAEDVGASREEEVKKEHPRLESPNSSDESASPASHKDVGTLPVKYDRGILPAPFRCLQLNLSDVVNWDQDNLFQWLVANDLEELIQPFREYNIAGPEVLTLNKSAPVFSQTKQKLGLVKRFFTAQETLLRATIPLFENSRFSCDAEQILALKEFIFRLAYRFAGDDSRP